MMAMGVLPWQVQFTFGAVIEVAFNQCGIEFKYPRRRARAARKLALYCEGALVACRSMRHIECEVTANGVHKKSLI